MHTKKLPHKNLKILPKINSYNNSRNMQYSPTSFTPQQAYNEISGKATFKIHANESFI